MKRLVVLIALFTTGTVAYAQQPPQPPEPLLPEHLGAKVKVGGDFRCTGIAYRDEGRLKLTKLRCTLKQR